CGEAGATPLELARVCQAWARVHGHLLSARSHSSAAPIVNREPQKSTGGGRKCSQLFSVEHEGGGGRAVRASFFLPPAGGRWARRSPHPAQRRRPRPPASSYSRVAPVHGALQ